MNQGNLFDVTNLTEKTCVHTYLAKFESCAEYNNWTVKDKAAHLKSALIGNAANLLQGNARATYDEVVELLQRRYGNSQQHEKFKLELKSRRRRPDEDIQSLAQRSKDWYIAPIHAHLPISVKHSVWIVSLAHWTTRLFNADSVKERLSLYMRPSPLL